MLQFYEWLRVGAVAPMANYIQRRQLKRRVTILELQLDTALEEMQEAVQHARRCERLLDMILAQKRHSL